MPRRATAPPPLERCEFNPLNAACPTRQVLNRIADRWSMLVILALGDGTLRFSELRRSVEGITQKMLTQTLRGLERDGLVTREALPTVPVTVRYTLTPLGHSLGEAVAVIRGWAFEHIDEVVEARAGYDARPAPSGPPTPVAASAA
jgi:DNA-binding HxlR family transcriptional regulator